ncbi:GIY-YIG nuclease family protein [Candidatus Nomurabacteria bacterium]|nr:GIY-YIG nuclease family protein [Candidatus Nomurabacteria bacterium]
MYFIYMLLCNDETIYTGTTNDIAKRVLDHNTSARAAKYTRSRRPVHLVYTEEVPTKGEALKREAVLKKLTREQKLALIKEGKI